MNKANKSDIAVKIFCYGFIGLFALICFYPLLMVLSVSFSTEQSVLREGYKILPQDFSLETYAYIFLNSGERIANSYIVTIATTVIGTLGSLMVTSLISFAISIKQLRYRNFIAFIANFTIIFSAGLIPWYMVCVNIVGLRDSIWALILPGMFSVWNMFLMRTYFQSISPSLYEAATIDGANYFLIYLRIAIPLSKTALLTIGLMYALQYWNNWWYALMFIQERDLFPLQYLLYSILSNVNAISSGRIPAGATSVVLPAETVKMAVTIITIGPIIFLYPFVQKYFVHGIMSGAIKE